MAMKELFSDAQRQAIADAAREAEGRTSGEIVPYVVGACDDYDEACWKSAALLALAAAVVAAAVYTLAGFWGQLVWLWIAAPPAIGGAVGYLTARLVPQVRRLVIDGETLDLRARRRAMTAFLEEELFATRDRTGILIFVALFEHRVVVLGDSGINRAVPDGAWEGIVSRIVAGIHEGRTAEALADAIRECGALLEAHRVEIRPDDTDELSNELRIRER